MFEFFGAQEMTGLSFMIRLTIALVIIIVLAFALPKIFPPTEKDIARAERKKAYKAEKKRKKEQKQKERKIKRAEKKRKDKLL